MQTTFYITESSAFKNKMLYFRQDDWDVLCRPLVERLTSVTFSKLEEVKTYFACLYDIYVVILARSRGNTTTAQIGFFLRPTAAKGHGSAADCQSSAEESGDPGDFFAI
jgi:hypothetical protein